MNSNRGIDIGGLPCPEWCDDHIGAKGTHAEIIPDDTPADACKSIGDHRTTVYWHKQFPDQPHATAVRVSQSIAVPGHWEPIIHFWHGTSGDENMEGQRPVTYRPIGAKEARELGEALIRAADLVGEILPGRCASCAEPISTEAGRDLCVRCLVDVRRRTWDARRANLKAVK